MEEEPHLKGILKIRQNEHGNYVADSEGDSSEDEDQGHFTVRLDQNTFCSMDDFSGRPLSLGYNSLNDLLGSQQVHHGSNLDHQLTI